MTYQAIAYQKREAIAYITLCRPEQGNRLNETMLLELAEACRLITDDEGVRAVVVAAQGRDFCLGWDATPVAEGPDPECLRRLVELADGFKFLAQIPRPTIATIAGDAISGGLELALACDVRIATAEARFGLPEVTYGLIPMAGGTQRLPLIVGPAKALEMILLGDLIDAQEAYRIGLANQLVSREELLTEAERWAQTFAERGPIALSYAKEAVQRGFDMPLDQALRLETDLAIILQTTEDRAEGVRAFLEKRRPHFHGR